VIRAQELGLENIWDHLSFYPLSLLRTHLGVKFLVAACLSLLVGLTARLSAGRQPTPGKNVGDTLVFCVLSLGVPLAILTLDVSKSTIVAGIAAPAVLWLVMFGSMRLGEVGHRTERW
jgi:hypothetical protein